MYPNSQNPNPNQPSPRSYQDPAFRPPASPAYPTPQPGSYNANLQGEPPVGYQADYQRQYSAMPSPYAQSTAQYPPQPAYSIDYLNQIAAPAPKAGLSKGMKTLLIAAGAMLLITLPLLLFSALSGSTTQISLDRLAARSSNLSAVISDSHDNIDSTELRQINSSLSASMKNISAGTTEQLKAQSTTLETAKKANPNETTGALSARLDDAELNATFDRSYVREMAFEVKTTLILIDSLGAKARDEATVDFLRQSYNNLNQSYEQLEAFGKTSE
ncbi:hypothetical protein FJZ39_02340 [Candidatus Saccharibacteria bacterium]|nr:hypothetical protein [Candidatus Saccharibacteria bacterium]